MILNWDADGIERPPKKYGRPAGTGCRIGPMVFKKPKPCCSCRLEFRELFDYCPHPNGEYSVWICQKCLREKAK